ncbi:acyltransferase family protein [Sphingobium sp. CECT 9361]|uniref:acyltransferase family protein n=1 Tax=Sphingobium sp. CECT 9361 TaxID=2845384 RepID=UPI001E462B18|nr:acyltransferase family protein [Sphingobium sp. CECT 9361]
MAGVQRADVTRQGGYFPHIDGLRCLAIASVVIYHAQFPFLHGGFVGVDLFFVISGFLIINGLDREVRGGGIKFRAFYFRRLRRLMPALVPMLAFVMLAGAMIYSPVDLKTLAASVIATLFFSANIFFYTKSGYFDTSAETRPLLHAWSLGIEEQFYILAPFSVWALWRLFGSRYAYGMAVLLVLSFVAAAVTVAYAPTAAFYLMPPRAWEFLAGGLVGIFGARIPASRRVREATAAVGLCLILSPILFYSTSMSFPGATAAIPVLGGAATIWADLHGRTVAGRVLALKPFIWLGGLSYSLYLWHWPILVFGRHLAGDDLSLAGRLGLVGLSVAAAWISTRLVEDGAQRCFSLLKPWRLIVPAAVSAVVLLVCAGTIFISSGWPQRRSAEHWKLAERNTWSNPDREACFSGTTISPKARTVDDIKAGRVCRMGVPGEPAKYLLWGDSHAEALRNAFDIAGRKAGLAGAFVGEGGCPPIPGIVDVSRGSDFHCKETNQAALDFIKREHIGIVVMHSRWVGVFTHDYIVPGPDGRPIHGDDQGAMAMQIMRTIDYFKKIGVTAVLVGPMVEPGYDVPGTIIGPACCQSTQRQLYARSQWLKSAQAIDNLLEPMARAHGIPYADPLLTYCTNEKCAANRGPLPLFYDYRHVGWAGAALFAPEAARLLQAGKARHEQLQKSR